MVMFVFETGDLLNNVRCGIKGYATSSSTPEWKHPTTATISDNNCNRQREEEENQFSIYDHEPGLEYDDSELKETKSETEDEGKSLLIHSISLNSINFDLNRIHKAFKSRAIELSVAC